MLISTSQKRIIFLSKTINSKAYYFLKNLKFIAKQSSILKKKITVKLNQVKVMMQTKAL